MANVATFFLTPEKARLFQRGDQTMLANKILIRGEDSLGLERLYRSDPAKFAGHLEQALQI